MDLALSSWAAPKMNSSFTFGGAEVNAGRAACQTSEPLSIEFDMNMKFSFMFEHSLAATLSAVKRK